MSRSIPVVLVTGASRGLGRGIAVHLAGMGYSVAVNYAANRNAAEHTAELCRAVQTDDRQQFVPFKADIGDRRERNAMIEEVVSTRGGLDGLVNNAGMAPRRRADLVEATEDSFEELMRVNLQGPYFLTQRAARYWLAERPTPRLPGGFKVVFITSISVYTASVNRGDYCVSKAGLAMAAQLWATRLAEEQIQVFELRPGIMETDMTSGVKEKYDALIAEGLVPQRRWGSGEDVGKAVGACLDGSLNFSTGAVIDVDGGFHLRRL